MSKKKQTQAYTEEFRREAVKRADQDGNTNASVAKELGLSAQQIYNWRRQFNRLSDKQFNSVELSPPGFRQDQTIPVIIYTCTHPGDQPV